MNGGCEADMTVYRFDQFTIFSRILWIAGRSSSLAGCHVSMTNSVELSDRFAIVSGRSSRTKVSTETLQDNRL
jgi:hypothetical protein